MGLAAFALCAAVTLAFVAAASQGGGSARPVELPAPFGAAAAAGDPADKAAGRRAATLAAELPLAFVPNRGQAGDEVLYAARAGAFAAGFTRTGVQINLASGGRGHALELRFLGARRHPVVDAGSRRRGRVTHLDRGAAAGALPTYGTVTYRDLWPGIDMTFDGRRGALKYEFHVARGADPADIRLAYAGADSLSLGPGGALLVGTSVGTLRDRPPRSYEIVGGKRAPVQSRYRLGPTPGGYGFDVRGHSRSHPLVIDPGIVYSTFLGGDEWESGVGIAVDAGGHAFVAGQSYSANYPATPGAYDTSANGDSDVVVSKLSADGSSLLYSTYIGDAAWDGAAALAVDAAGSAYVTGHTYSPEFPVTPGAYDTTFSSDSDLFVAKLNPEGTGLEYSTLLGGGVYSEIASDIAVDAGGNAYVTGQAGLFFPATSGAYDTTDAGNGDTFVAKLNASGSGLVYSTRIGGSGSERGSGIAVDDAGKAYVAGSTSGGDFPTTPGAFDGTANGQADAFVASLDPAGSALVYSTLLGGTTADFAADVAVDAGGSAHVVGGFDYPGGFPTTPGAYDTENSSFGESFAAKLDPSGSSLVYSTFLGEDRNDLPSAVALDAGGSAYIGGVTDSGDFSLPGDGYLKRLSPTGADVTYSTRLGGELTHDAVGDVALGEQGSVYVVGGTGALDFPVTEGAFDGELGRGPHDMFVTKLRVSGDADSDGVDDGEDNCAGHANAAQGDSDGDGLGDACDADRDGDRHPNGQDNCPGTANAGQLDDDSDGTGNRCDPDWTPTSCAPAGAQAAATTPPYAAAGVREAPLLFVPNRGQTDEAVHFEARGPGAQAFFTDAGMTLALARGDDGHALALRFVGANRDPVVEADAPNAVRVSYLTTGASRADLPSYGEVTYRDLWPGIDMVFRGDRGTLKYEFHVAPRADPSDIRLSYAGARRLSPGAGGSLRIDTSVGVVRDARPRSYEIVDGQRVAVASRYRLERARNRYGFVVRGRDPERALVIDPEIMYSKALSGLSVDEGNAVAVDVQGNAYVSGMTFSSDFPITPGAFDPQQSGGRDAFAAKLDATGEVTYATYVGGAADDEAKGIAVDGQGGAYVVGTTSSADFPVTGGAEDATHNGGTDAFALRIDPTGANLTYATFLGGAEDDGAAAVALDSSGRAHLTGQTASPGFPTTSGAFDTTYNSDPPATLFDVPGDVFATKLDSAGDLSYSTFIGGSQNDHGRGIALDPAGSAYITGQTQSGPDNGDTEFPTTEGVWDQTYGFSGDAFVTKLSPDGANLEYSTFLSDRRDIRGGATDTGTAIAVSANGSAYVTGRTLGREVFPLTPGAADDTAGPRSEFEGFVTLLDATGSRLVYSTFLGGEYEETPLGIAVDGTGEAWVTGLTRSQDFPVTPDAADSTAGGPMDAFLTRVNESGTALLYSTYHGGEENDDSRGIALDPRGAVYITGISENFEIGDAYVLKVAEVDCDGDGVPTEDDNCPATSNADQRDTDGDGTGDACDATPGTTPGCRVEGSGRLEANPSARFSLRIDTAAMRHARLSFTDNRARVRLRSVEIESVIVDGAGAVIRGTGRVGSDAVDLRAEVEGAGQSTPRGTFAIELSSGYSTEGAVRSGRLIVGCG